MPPRSRHLRSLLRPAPLLAALAAGFSGIAGLSRAARGDESPASRPSAAAPAAATPAVGGVTLLGTASLPADATDRSGLSGAVENGIPRNRLGSLGSALAYTGTGDRFLACADRGPGDGLNSYEARWHELEIRVRPGETPAVGVELRGTTLLRDERGRNYIGLAAALDPDAAHGRRLDPEGIRVGPGGHIYVSDEYGPSVLEFDPRGGLVRALPVPPKFAVARPRGDKLEEIASNTAGRVTNQGFEGLALTPGGGALIALLQQPLIQDGGKDGLNCRAVRFDLRTGATAELVVPLAAKGYGFSELVALNDDKFLALERDAGIGEAAAYKRIVKLDLRGVTDVSGVAALPPGAALPAATVAAKREPFLDLLDPAFGLAGPSFPEKIEGLAFGPDLPDGRHVLVVSVDNDFKPDTPNTFYVFAVPATALPGYVPQRLGGESVSWIGSGKAGP